MKQDGRGGSGGGGRLINRELSWLEFNQRVLEEARDEGNPLLERLKFLAISASNLDEFYMVRVGELVRMDRHGYRQRGPSGMTPKQQLRAINRRIRAIVADQYTLYRAELVPALAAAGIRRVKPAELSVAQHEYLRQVFENELHPVISPMPAGNEHRISPLLNLRMYLAVRLDSDGAGGETLLIPLVAANRRFILLPAIGEVQYIRIEDVVPLFLEQWFPGRTVMDAAPFRITRNADIAVREDLAADLLAGMEDVLEARKVSPCIRLEVAGDMSHPLQEFLKGMLAVGDDHVFPVDGPLGLCDFMTLAVMAGFDALRDEPWPPRPSPDVDLQVPLIDQIAARDILLVHPYESFDPVVRFVEEAAEDPDVLAIKQVLYRTSSESAIVEALAQAAERGKTVTALVELKARFDEARNMGRARRLEQAGVQVIYGVKRLKTHAKLCVVVRREPQGIVRYLHFGTGNYNEATARLYTDISLFTCDPVLGRDASAVFNAITGCSEPRPMPRLVMAPFGLREAIIEQIDGEIIRSRQGQRAMIMAKLNALADPEIIEKLYQASEAGVRIQLNVRGICCLRAGVPGLSDHISVVSIVDRFLEHARVLYFYQGGAEKVFITSADWMPRNLDRRVELLVPVDDPACRRKLVRMLRTQLNDQCKGRILQPDGTYARPPERRERRSQWILYREACEAVDRRLQTRPTMLEPHLPQDGASM